MAKFRDDDFRQKEEDKKWRLEINRRQSERKKSKTLDDLSVYDHQKAYRQIRIECIPGSSGNVKFQLQALREERSNSLILAALRDLPRDFPEKFGRILSKFTETNDVDLGRQIFRWVGVAKHPLTVEDLREALGIRPSQEAWDDSTYINGMKKVACCGNLVFIEEEY
ncbi:hypothetical protein BDR22DRAFT_822541 [Usnea florida]